MAVALVCFKPALLKIAWCPVSPKLTVRLMLTTLSLIGFGLLALCLAMRNATITATFLPASDGAE